MSTRVVDFNINMECDKLFCTSTNFDLLLGFFSTLLLLKEKFTFIVQSKDSAHETDHALKTVQNEVLLQANDCN